MRTDEEVDAEADRMLKKIGWDKSDLDQIDIYARMTSAQRISHMLNWRRQMMFMLETRLRQEYPNASRQEFALLVQRELVSPEEGVPGA